MKYLLSIAIFCIFTTTVFSQFPDSLQWEEKGELHIDKDEIWSVDGLENVFITSNNVINKYDSIGELKFSQSIKSLGRLRDLQSINTMKLVTFSEEQQTICLLDNTLTLSEECLDLSNFSIDNASHIAVSGQSDKIWVVDQLNSKLLLLSLGSTDQFQEIKNLKGILNISQIIEIQEANNELFLSDSNGNIYQFDLYGSLVNKYEFKELDGFVVKNENLILLQNNQLIVSNLSGQEINYIKLPIKNVCDVKISGNFFYFRAENKILKYSLTLRN